MPVISSGIAPFLTLSCMLLEEQPGENSFWTIIIVISNSVNGKEHVVHGTEGLTEHAIVSCFSVPFFMLLVSPSSSTLSPVSIPLLKETIIKH